MPDDDDADVVDAQVVRIAFVAALIAAVGLAWLVGWLGFRAYEVERQEARGRLFAQTAQDVAVNLSSVDNAKQTRTRSLGTVIDVAELARVQSTTAAKDSTGAILTFRCDRIDHGVAATREKLTDNFLGAVVLAFQRSGDARHDRGRWLTSEFDHY